MRKLNCVCAVEWNQVVFNNESRFNYSSVLTIVFVCGDPLETPCGERLDPVFTATRRSRRLCVGMGCHCLQYTVTPNIDPWHHMKAQQYVRDILQQHALPFLIKTMFGHTRQGCHKTQLLPFLSLPDLQICLHLIILGIIWGCEFERTRGKVTENMEGNVSRHHAELVCLNARSYRIVHPARGY
ncbi:transposable element Tcb1 transposase [Trichonephila clavipes]|nr:transposable element Tcb1 transposase [Trichonephila clavipes]